MYYDKRIRYLSYYESGIKLQNAGYVKFQVRDSLCQMVIYVKGPRLMGSGEAKVYLLSASKEKREENGYYQENRKNDRKKHLLGTLGIRNGQGYCAVRLNAENMADSGMWYDEICGIRIELHEYQYLESQWTVMNFMPEQNRRQDKDHTSYNQSQQQNDNGMAMKYGRNREERRETGNGQNREVSRKMEYVQNRMDEPAEDTPVEINLLVTPVSENLRVEKVVKEVPMQEIEEIEGVTTEKYEEKIVPPMPEERATEQIIIEMAKDMNMKDSKREMPVIEEMEKSEVKPLDEEESMQEMLEKEVLREEAKEAQSAQRQQREQQSRVEQQNQTAQQSQAVQQSQTAQQNRTVQMLEKEILQGMEDWEMQDMAEEIRLPEQELQPDKWEQLKKTYPVVHPIREEEEYLKIAPKDFVIFTEKYQELVHNSFLLHGYYNYKHLILGKKEQNGKVIYYLGVPGTFHEREKTVAVMFGFEAFDGKREPAENGDFGYYLRKVEI